MKLRIASALMLAGAFLFCAAVCSADKITATGKSSYGNGSTAGLSLENGTLPQSLSNGFSESIDCGGNGMCPAALEIDIPNLAAGTVIYITGAGDFLGIYCSDSFLGSCDNMAVTETQLSTAQQSCLTSLEAGSTFNPTTDVLKITAVSCSLTTNGNEMALLFDDPNGAFPTLTISTTPATAPEPGSLTLLGAGLIGLWGLKRSRLVA
jgi:hypothetical protein